MGNQHTQNRDFSSKMNAINRSKKKEIQEMLVSSGFQPNYIGRAFKVYEKNYGHSYNFEVITEIIVRLQNKDRAKQKDKPIDSKNEKDNHPKHPKKRRPNKPPPTKPASYPPPQQMQKPKQLPTNDNKQFNDDNVEQHVIDTLGNDIDVDEKKSMNEEIDIDLGDMDGVTKQFYYFLKENRLEKYFEKFKENDCCCITDVEYLINDDDFLKNEIGINRQFERDRFKGKGKTLKDNMDQFKNLKIPGILLNKLSKHGVVTMDILCNQVKHKLDLKQKFAINNEKQCNLLYNLMDLHLNDNEDKIDQQKGVQNVHDNDNDNDVMNTETPYI